eukprot:TRINITY_DN12457_c0_g1_i1.p1 TRINITY_DN12457_c0_g1~~TRINITY_DN12457_c0_g1_i1.p1  ORF type:complete len:567 (-),score=-1.98 TRINITY_DN12457_c0_g1_i1:2-1702(-)
MPLRPNKVPQILRPRGTWGDRARGTRERKLQPKPSPGHSKPKPLPQQEQFDLDPVRAEYTTHKKGLDTTRYTFYSPSQIFFREEFYKEAAEILGQTEAGIKHFYAKRRDSGMHLNFTLDELYHIVYKCRTCNSLHLVINGGTTRDWKSFVESAWKISWGDFISYETWVEKLPVIKVKTSANTRLHVGAGLINRAATVIEHKMLRKGMPDPQEHEPCLYNNPMNDRARAASVSFCRIAISNSNECQFLINASGVPIYNRGTTPRLRVGRWKPGERIPNRLLSSELASCLRMVGLMLPPTASAEQRWEFMNTHKFWDPFCGVGVVLIELITSLLFNNALSYPYASQIRTYAFQDWPTTKSHIRTEKFLKQLQEEQEQLTQELVTLFNTTNTGGIKKPKISDHYELVQALEFAVGSDTEPTAIKRAYQNAKSSALLAPSARQYGQQLFQEVDIQTMYDRLTQPTIVLTMIPEYATPKTLNAFMKMLPDKKKIPEAYVFVPHQKYDMFIAEAQRHRVAWTTVCKFLCAGWPMKFLKLSRSKGRSPGVTGVKKRTPRALKFKGLGPLKGEN